jgi:hypothetical protein
MSETTSPEPQFEDPRIGTFVPFVERDGGVVPALVLKKVKKHKTADGQMPSGITTTRSLSGYQYIYDDNGKPVMEEFLQLMVFTVCDRDNYKAFCKA